ncbi:MAG: 30S ribosomal protein S7 [Rickettsiales bacterium]
MPRKAKVNLIRVVEADTKYNSIFLGKLINKIMYDGKKSKAEFIAWKAMDIIKETLNSDPILVFENALFNLTPMYVLKRTKVGGANHQVPVLAPQRKAQFVSFDFLITAARNRGERSFQIKLAKEIIDANNKMGIAFKKLEDHKKMVEANRAFGK